jgi:hypothetical protein
LIRFLKDLAFQQTIEDLERTKKIFGIKFALKATQKITSNGDFICSNITGK